MFNNLIESRAAKQKRVGGTVLSFVIHGALIGGAIWATYGVGHAIEKVKAEKVDFVEAKKEDPPPPKDEPKPPPPPDVVAAPPPPKGFQILTAPIKIPDVLPDIDLTRAVTNEADFTGKGAVGGTAKGVIGGTPAPISDAPLFDFQVEKQVAPAPGNKPPDYPPMLRQSNVEGSVTVQFVVDTTGKAEMSTFKEIKSDHPLFTSAVKAHLPSMRFIPAEVGSRKVKQLVQMPFVFTLSMNHE